VKSIDLADLDSVLSERLSVACEGSKAYLERTLQSPGAPNTEISTSVTEYRSKKWILYAAISSWYMDAVGYLVQLDVLELVNKDKNLKLKDKEEILVCLSSKFSMLNFVQARWTDRDFYGNILSNLELTARRIHVLKLEPHKPKKKVRRRGYQDSGSCRSLSAWKPSRDFSLTDLQNEIERERQEIQDTVLFLRGFLGEY